MTEVKISLYGELTAASAGVPIGLPRSRKVRGLLALLALSPNGISREQLCELLFPNAKDARASLRWAISRLRGAFDDGAQLVQSAERKLTLNWQRVETDFDQLRASQAALHRLDSSELETVQAQALGVRGPLLANLQIDESSAFETWKLARQSDGLAAHRQLIEALIERCEQNEHKVALARALVEADPLSERAWARLVTELNQDGRLEEAQQTHDLANQRLEHEGMPLLGELQQALDKRPAPTELSTLIGADKHRAKLAVFPCSSEDPSLSEQLIYCAGDGILSAANANRACVILARSVTRAAMAATGDARAAGARLSADLVLEGRLQLKSDAYELALELIDVATGTCVMNWREAFAQDSPEAVGDAINARFSARFEIDLQMVLIARAYSKAEADRGLWDRYFLALPRIYSPEGHDPDESLKMLQGVIDSEPGMGPAVCAAAWVRTTHPQHNEDPAAIKITSRMARRAIELCQDDAFIMGLAAIVIANTEGDLAMARGVTEHALSFNPFSTIALMANGIVEHYSGRHAHALEVFERTKAATNTEPVTFVIDAYSSLSYYMLQKPDAALQLAQKSCGRNPGFVVGRRALMLSLFISGDLDGAMQQAHRLHEFDASETVAFHRRQAPYQISSEVEKLCADLARCGLPER